jgi:hypothetical protein
MNTLVHADDLTIHDISGGNVEHLEAMLDLMKALFPQYVYNLPRVRQRAYQAPDADARCINHQWLAEVDGHAAGLISFKYVHAYNLGLLVYLAVKPEYRLPFEDVPCRLSEILLISALDQLQIDAQQSGRRGPVHLAAEVEYPELVERYKHYGFVELPVEYHEPPTSYEPGTFRPEMEAGADAYRPMYLGIFPARGATVDPADGDTLRSVLLAFYVEHYGLPEDHWAIQRALQTFCQES